MSDNVVREETLYTYDAAVNEYERRKYHEWLCRQRRLQTIRTEQKERRRYFCNQKLYGLLIAVLSAVLLVLTQDGFAVIGIAAGIAIIITKKMVIYNEYYRTHGGMEQWNRTSRLLRK